MKRKSGLIAFGAYVVGRIVIESAILARLIPTDWAKQTASWLFDLGGDRMIREIFTLGVALIIGGLLLFLDRWLHIIPKLVPLFRRLLGFQPNLEILYVGNPRLTKTIPNTEYLCEIGIKNHSFYSIDQVDTRIISAIGAEDFHGPQTLLTKRITIHRDDTSLVPMAQCIYYTDDQSMEIKLDVSQHGEDYIVINPEIKLELRAFGKDNASKSKSFFLGVGEDNKPILEIWDDSRHEIDTSHISRRKLPGDVDRRLEQHSPTTATEIDRNIQRSKNLELKESLLFLSRNYMVGTDKLHDRSITSDQQYEEFDSWFTEWDRDNSEILKNFDEFDKNRYDRLGVFPAPGIQDGYNTPHNKLLQVLWRKLEILNRVMDKYQ